MALNESKGNMYDFVTHTWNTVKGECLHDCSYCYMKRWGKLNPTRFDSKELKTDLGSGNFIFVGSSCDMFAKNVIDDWVYRTLEHCMKFDNKYLFQTKNPKKMIEFDTPSLDSVLCTTIETNRFYKEIMKASPTPEERVDAMEYSIKKNYITIEPIMDFDINEMVEMIKKCDPVQVNIGADSGRNYLPEPSKEKVLMLIEELQKFTKIARKTNLKRLLA